MGFFGKGLTNPNMFRLIENSENPKIPKIDFIFRDDYINFEQKFSSSPIATFSDTSKKFRESQIDFLFRCDIYINFYNSFASSPTATFSEILKLEFRINFRETPALQNSILQWTALSRSMAAAIKV